ncbi:ZN414 protein, partial [Psilopogon haemacephalus]|nr:ZN414 protein [Psilopogon haemacephalus]
AHQPARAARLAGGAAAGAASSAPLPSAGDQPLRPGLRDALLRGAAPAAAAAPFLGAGAVPALRAPLRLQPAPALGAASPAVPAAGPRRLQRRLEEEPRCERQPTPPMLWLRSDSSCVLPSWPTLAGHSSTSRIVWEHTRGRYTCMQCAYSAASRQEMTLHIEEHRKNLPQHGRLEAEMDFGVGLTSFHTKLTPEMENSLYSQL